MAEFRKICSAISGYIAIHRAQPMHFFKSYLGCPGVAIVAAPAEQFLKDHGIFMNAAGITANVPTRDKSAVCPGEVIALNTKDFVDFIRQIKTMPDNQRK